MVTDLQTPITHNRRQCNKDHHKITDRANHVLHHLPLMQVRRNETMMGHEVVVISAGRKEVGVGVEDPDLKVMKSQIVLAQATMAIEGLLRIVMVIALEVLATTRTKVKRGHREVSKLNCGRKFDDLFVIQVPQEEEDNHQTTIKVEEILDLSLRTKINRTIHLHQHRIIIPIAIGNQLRMKVMRMIMERVMVVMDHQEQDRLLYPRPGDMTILLQHILLSPKHIDTMRHQGTIIKIIITIIILLGLECTSTHTLVMMDKGIKMV